MRLIYTLPTLLAFFFSYQASADKNEIQVKSIQYRTLTKVIKPSDKIKIPNFYTMDLSDLNKDGKVTVDQILFSEKDSSAAFVKYGVEPKNSKLIGQLLKDSSNNAFIFHGKDNKARPLAIYFYKFSREESSKLLRKIQDFDKTYAYETPSQIQKKWWPSVWNLIVPSAYGEQTPVCKKTTDDALKGSFGFGRMLSTVGECIGGFMRGSWSSTGGLVAGLFDGSIWIGVKDTVQGLSNLFDNFKETIAESYQGLLDLPIEKQARLFCDVVGVLVTNLAVTVITDGVGALHGGTLAVGRITMLMRGAISGLETKGSWKKDLEKAKCVALPQSNNTQTKPSSSPQSTK